MWGWPVGFARGVGEHLVCSPCGGGRAVGVLASGGAARVTD
jgi:hypothetical protein